MPRPLLSLILVLAAACDVGQPWRPCGDFAGEPLCTPGYHCLADAHGDMCVPACGDAVAEPPEATCEADAPLSIIPLGQVFACTDDNLCVALCDEQTPCGDGQVCADGWCLWP